MLLANLRTLSSSHLASKVAWSHFALVGEICPQAPLNDFCKIGCAPLGLNNPEMARFVEMCFDPGSAMNERLKATLVQMLSEVDTK